MVPWWISHWRVEAALLGLPMLRFFGGRSARPRRRRNLGFIWPICNTGDRHTGSGFSDAAFGCHRTISLCPKSDIRGSCEHYPWSGLDLRERQPVRIRRACLAFFSPRCADLRRTNPNGEFWFRVRGLLCRGPAVDSPPHPMDSSSGRVKAYGEAGQTGVRGNYSLLVARRLPIPRLLAWSTLLPLGTFVENAARSRRRGATAVETGSQTRVWGGIW